MGSVHSYEFAFFQGSLKISHNIAAPTILALPQQMPSGSEEGNEMVSSVGAGGGKEREKKDDETGAGAKPAFHSRMLEALYAQGVRDLTIENKNCQDSENCEGNYDFKIGSHDEVPSKGNRILLYLPEAVELTQKQKDDIEGISVGHTKRALFRWKCQDHPDKRGRDTVVVVCAFSNMCMVADWAKQFFVKHTKEQYTEMAEDARTPIAKFKDPNSKFWFSYETYRRIWEKDVPQKIARKNAGVKWKIKGCSVCYPVRVKMVNSITGPMPTSHDDSEHDVIDDNINYNMRCAWCKTAMVDEVMNPDSMYVIHAFAGQGYRSRKTKTISAEDFNSDRAACSQNCALKLLDKFIHNGIHISLVLAGFNSRQDLVNNDHFFREAIVYALKLSEISDNDVIVKRIRPTDILKEFLVKFLVNKGTLETEWAKQLKLALDASTFLERFQNKLSILLKHTGQIFTTEFSEPEKSDSKPPANRPKSQNIEMRPYKHKYYPAVHQKRNSKVMESLKSEKYKAKSDHKFTSLGQLFQEEMASQTSPGASETSQISEKFQLTIRHAGGRNEVGHVELIFVSESKLKCSQESMAPLRSLCTIMAGSQLLCDLSTVLNCCVIYRLDYFTIVTSTDTYIYAGRDAENVMIPSAVEEQDFVLLVLSNSQWSEALHRNGAKIYTAIFNKKDKAQFGIALVSDNLLPGNANNISHRRLVSLRIAMKLLNGVKLCTGLKKQVKWQQW